jgi:hypothetical protein
MKKLVFVGLLLPLNMLAQQFTIDPANQNEDIVIEGLDTLGGDLITVGWWSSNAFISRQTIDGQLIWARKSVDVNDFRDVSVSPYGHIVAVGTWYYGQGMVSVFDGDGGLLWSFGFGQPGSFFRKVVADSSGIYIVGEIGPANAKRGLAIKMDYSGNVVWSNELGNVGGRDFFRKVFILGDHLVVFGDYFLGTLRFAAMKYSLLTGDLIDYRVFGNPSLTHTFLDAVQSDDGFFVSYKSQNSQDIMLAKLDNDLGVVKRVSVYVTTINVNSLNLGVLTIDPDGNIYVSGWLIGTGFESSFILKVDDGLSNPLWAKRLFEGNGLSGVSSTILGDSIALCKTRGSSFHGSISGAMVTMFSFGGNAETQCSNPTPFNFWVLDIMDAFPVSYPSRTQETLLLTSWDLEFEPCSPFVLNCDPTVLPITLLSFTGEAKEGKAHLSWQTASEESNDHFRIERSVDLSSWEVVGRVDGAGTSHITNSYELVDSNPFTGINYYKLTQVDEDGTEESFNIVVINFTMLEKLTAYPNPARVGELIRVSTDAIMDLTVHDATGRHVNYHRVDNGLVIDQPGQYLLSIPPLVVRVVVE